MSNIYVRLSAFVVLSLVAVAGVTADGLFGRNRPERGSGTVIEESRDLETFDRIHVEGSTSVFVKSGSQQSVRVIADDNLMDNIVTRVGGGRLTIEAEGSFTSREGIEIEIVIPRLSRVDIRGSGNMNIEDMVCEDLDLRVSGSGDVTFEGSATVVDVAIDGSGDVTLTGSADEIRVRLSGSGDVDASNLTTGIADVSIRGSGDATVFAAEEFDGSVSGSGDIRVYGNPKLVSRSVRGSGDIHFRR